MNMVILPGLNQKLNFTAIAKTKIGTAGKPNSCIVHKGFVVMETVVVSLGAVVNNISTDRVHIMHCGLSQLSL